MLTTWEYSHQTEVLRLLHTAHYLANGFYSTHNFIILPTSDPPREDNVVLLPNLNYLSIPRFWERVSRLDFESGPLFSAPIPPSLLNSTSKLLQSAPPRPAQFASTQSIWTQYESHIISTIYALIPTCNQSISHIHIWPTTFGTACSFNHSHEPPFNLQIWLRDDMGVGGIVEAILTSLVHPQVSHYLGGLWSESELLVDWLLTFSPLSLLLKQADPTFTNRLTIKTLRSTQNALLQKQSSAFLNHLGAPHNQDNLISRLNHIPFNPRERLVINQLISLPHHTATFDQVGEVLFSTNLDYSLYSISKFIQRLRNKLESHGLSGSLIQTQRGVGYSLLLT